MARPIHIAALDEALKSALAQLPAAEANVVTVLDEHIEELETIEARILEASQARNDVISGIKKCAESIKTLGYCLPDGVPSMNDVEALTWSMPRDRGAARERLAARN